MTNERAILLLCQHYKDMGEDYPAMDIAIEAIKAQRVGKWSRPRVVFMPYTFAYECTVCRKWGNIETFEANYCPNCGAKMEGRDYGSK